MELCLYLITPRSGMPTDPIFFTVAKRKTLFDDRPNEINELTFVIKQDLASLNAQISSLQSISKSQNPHSSRGASEQEGEHNKNVSIVGLISRYAGAYMRFRRLWCFYKASLQTSELISKRSWKSERKTSKHLEHARRTSYHPYLHTLKLH